MVPPPSPPPRRATRTENEEAYANDPEVKALQKRNDELADAYSFWSYGLIFRRVMPDDVQREYRDVGRKLQEKMREYGLIE
jgi:hypothetical protein